MLDVIIIYYVIICMLHALSQCAICLWNTVTLWVGDMLYSFYWYVFYIKFGAGELIKVT